MKRSNIVQLQVSRDQSTFLLNLVDKELERLLQLTNNQMRMDDLSAGESNLVYQDKSMCYALAQLLEQSVKIK